MCSSGVDVDVVVGVCCAQLHDFGAILKLDNGDRILTHLKRLLWFFIKIGGQKASQYIRCMVINQTVLMHLRRINHPVWVMFHHNAACFNEEVGELSFSVLSRQVAGSSAQSELPLLNRKYRTSKVQLETASDLNVDVSRHQQGDKAGHTHIKEGDASVVATAAHFNLVIRQLKNNSFKEAEDVLRYKGAAVVRPDMAVGEAGLQVPLWVSGAPKAADAADAFFISAFRFCRTAFVQRFPMAWPMPVVHPGVNLGVHILAQVPHAMNPQSNQLDDLQDEDDAELERQVAQAAAKLNPKGASKEHRTTDDEYEDRNEHSSSRGRKKKSKPRSGGGRKRDGPSRSSSSQSAKSSKQGSNKQRSKKASKRVRARSPSPPQMGSSDESDDEGTAAVIAATQPRRNSSRSKRQKVPYDDGEFPDGVMEIVESGDEKCQRTGDHADFFSGDQESSGREDDEIQ